MLPKLAVLEALDSNRITTPSDTSLFNYIGKLAQCKETADPNGNTSFFPASAGMASNVSRVCDVGGLPANVVRSTRSANTLLCAVPDFVKDKLYKKIQKAEWLAYYYSDGSVTKAPGAVMGNKTYAFRREKRIASAVKGLLAQEGSCLWLTCTMPYEKTNKGRKASWQAVKEQQEPFLRKLRALGMSAYIAVKEAHADGGCHVHIVAGWENQLQSFERREWDDKNKKWVSRTRLGNASLREAIKEAWPSGHVDVQVVRDEKIGSYLVKELGKASHIEDALRRARRNWEKDDDEKHRARDCKKLWAVYFAGKLKIRMITTSRNLPAVEPEEEEEAPPCDLINTMTNSTKPVLIEILPIPWELKKWDWFEPYTGKVDPGGEEYRKLQAYLRWERLNGLEEGATLRGS